MNAPGRQKEKTKKEKRFVEDYGGCQKKETKQARKEDKN